MLRRLVYLGIKELSGIAEDVIIVTSSLTKDMTGKEDSYRAAAIRALCTITDPVMLQVRIITLVSFVVDQDPFFVWMWFLFKKIEIAGTKKQNTNPYMNHPKFKNPDPHLKTESATMNNYHALAVISVYLPEDTVPVPF